MQELGKEKRDREEVSNKFIKATTAKVKTQRGGKSNLLDRGSRDKPKK